MRSLIINYNIFKNGFYGLRLKGQDENNPETGTLIENNIFENQYNYGIASYYQDSLVIRSNLFLSGSSTSTSISCNYCNNQLIIDKNFQL